MDYPRFIVTTQKEESVSIQRVDNYDGEYRNSVGRDSDTWPVSLGFESHRQRCVISLRKALHPHSSVLVQPRKTYAMTETLLGVTLVLYELKLKQKLFSKIKI